MNVNITQEQFDSMVLVTFLARAYQGGTPVEPDTPEYYAVMQECNEKVIKNLGLEDVVRECGDDCGCRKIK